MAITTTQVQNLADSIAQAISDFNTNFVTGTATAATTINTGVAGTGSTQTVGRILNYLDLSSESALLTKANTAAANVAADITGRRSLTAFYSNYYQLLDALDTLVGGLNAYLTTNTFQVNALFAAAFNAYVQNSLALGFRSSANLPAQIAVANYFPYAAVDTMWGFTASGATTFSANAVGVNASTSVSGGGVGTIYIYKNNSGNAAGGATFTITYTNAAGNSASGTYSTVSGTPTASGSLSAGFSTALIGSAITAVTGTGMTAAEQYTLGIKLVRAPGY